jgi:hypothetical protein
MRAALLSLLLLAHTARADDRVYLHAELDPLTFANGGYGGQLGVRLPQLRGVRLAIASFSLHVPDVLSQIGNAGFDERVEPSAALYVLYYFRPAGHDGFSVGGSVRWLRVRFEHDAEPGLEAHIKELSPEAIVGYQWHPFHNGFYLQPWFALGVTLWRDHDPVVGTHRYSELPVSPFFTVNIGYEQAL